MLNIEKYKDNILNAAQSDITCCVIDCSIMVYVQIIVKTAKKKL